MRKIDLLVNVALRKAKLRLISKRIFKGGSSTKDMKKMIYLLLMSLIMNCSEEISYASIASRSQGNMRYSVELRGKNSQSEVLKFSTLIGSGLDWKISR